ncbi:MAG TPA: DUF6496 domain-containing protein [Bryobacteraceae bacterium]|nr:DUF6496 domain-containing protein [Bryobacteraceae bacterium]
MAAKKKSTGKKTAAKKSAAKKSSSERSSAKESPGARRKVGKVMHEYKHGQLKSGGKRKVKNPKQAIAIALSEARQAGEKVTPPKKKSTAKKSSGRGSSKKSSTKKSSARKSSRKS